MTNTDTWERLVGWWMEAFVDAPSFGVSNGASTARLVLSAIFASLVGWERGARNKPAGLKTHILVAVGSCCFTLITLRTTAMVEQGTTLGRMDPTRVIEGIVGGLGFLGAGAIIQSRGSVSGLTTAAGLWVVGSIGVAVGLGLPWIALSALLIVLAVLTFVRGVEHKLNLGGSDAQENGNVRSSPERQCPRPTGGTSDVDGDQP